MSIEQIVLDVTKIKQKLNLCLAESPQNSEIKQISTKPHCFLISLSTIQKNKTILCPYYYDFKYQYKKIIEIIERTSIENLAHKLRLVIKNGYYIFQDRNKLVFHEKVIKTLSAVLDSFC